MTVIITKLTDKEQPAHWRVMVTDGFREVYHDSASTEQDAYRSVITYFQRRLQ